MANAIDVRATAIPAIEMLDAGADQKGDPRPPNRAKAWKTRSARPAFRRVIAPAA